MGGELWALPFFALPPKAGTSLKIVWRMTGQGTLRLSAIGPAGQIVGPDFGPEGHGGSNWSRPGDEWGSGFTFPVSGCWDLRAVRPSLAGDVYLLVS